MTEGFSPKGGESRVSDQAHVAVDRREQMRRAETDTFRLARSNGEHDRGSCQLPSVCSEISFRTTLTGKNILSGFDASGRKP